MDPSNDGDRVRAFHRGQMRKVCHARLCLESISNTYHIRLVTRAESRK